MNQPNLQAVKEWAKAKTSDIDNAPPPWEWLQYMKIIEAIDMLGNPMTITIASTDEEPRTEGSRECASHSGNVHQLADRMLQRDRTLPQTDPQH